MEGFTKVVSCILIIQTSNLLIIALFLCSLIVKKSIIVIWGSRPICSSEMPALNILMIHHKWMEIPQKVSHISYILRRDLQDSPQNQST